MDDPIDLTRLAALREESPKSLMGCIRLAWPDIKSALDRGHSLKLIHERLNECGIRIGYRHLSVYVGRLRRQTPAPVPSKSASGPQPDATATLQRDRAAHRREKEQISPEDSRPDPLANVRERMKKRPGFQFSDEPADEDKLI
jgi:hypothetical protein